MDLTSRPRVRFSRRVDQKPGDQTCRHGQAGSKEHDGSKGVHEGGINRLTQAAPELTR